MVRRNKYFETRRGKHLKFGYVKVRKTKNGQYSCTIPKKIAEITHMRAGSIIQFTRLETDKIKINLIDDPEVAFEKYPLSSESKSFLSAAQQSPEQ